jgi:isopentenyldiphosphate isomerase
MMEHVECFDHQNKSLNRLKPRPDMKNAAEYFRVLHAWITNDNGEYLVQKRAKKDDVKPFMWAFTTGMLKPFEAPVNGIIREVDEELGIKITMNDWNLIKIISTHHHPYKTHTYIYQTRLNDINDCILNDEVSAIEWWSLAKIQKAMDAGHFWDYPSLLHDPDYF